MCRPDANRLATPSAARKAALGYHAEPRPDRGPVPDRVTAGYFPLGYPIYATCGV